MCFYRFLQSFWYDKLGYGIRALTHQSLCPCLENRQQYVTINTTSSSSSQIGLDEPRNIAIFNVY